MICRCISELADIAACSYARADGNHCVDWTLLQKLKYSAGVLFVVLVDDAIDTDDCQDVM